MNLVDMALQALLYQRSGRHAHDADLREFLRSAEARVEGEVSRSLLAQIRRAFEAFIERDAGASPRDLPGEPPRDGIDGVGTARSATGAAPSSD